MLYSPYKGGVCYIFVCTIDINININIYYMFISQRGGPMLLEIPFLKDAMLCYGAPFLPFMCMASGIEASSIYGHIIINALQ